MSKIQFIYLERVPIQELKAVFERVLGVNMTPTEEHDFFFYYETPLFELSVGKPHPASRIFSIQPCPTLISTDIRVGFRSGFKDTLAVDFLAVQCINAILKKFDIDVLMIFEDCTPRLVRCCGQVLIAWPTLSTTRTFWNRPETGILNFLTVPYEKSELIIQPEF